MLFKLGNLEFEEVMSRKDLLGIPVVEALTNIKDIGQVGVAAIDPELSDTQAFCAHYRIGTDQAANCVIIESRHGNRNFLAACVVLAMTRIDVNGVFRSVTGAKKASFASMETATAESRMEYGAITPIGLPLEWPLLIDKAVIEADFVVIGSGIRSSKIAMPGAILKELPNAQIIDGLASIPKIIEHEDN